MYDELVKLLRKKYDQAPMVMEAADAIEELQRQIDGWIEQERKTLLKSLPRWIPVTERLPGIGEDVLFSVGRGLYVAEGCLRADGDWTQFRWDTIQPKDVVDAWMPLPAPEPPKEEA